MIRRARRTALPAAIHTLVYKMNGDTGCFMSLAEGPEQRNWTSIGGEQRWMHVQTTEARQVDDDAWDQERETGYTDYIWPIGCQRGDGLRLCEAMYFPHRDFVYPGCLYYRGMQR